MATYRVIAASEIDPDSPVTANVMTALDSNPTAIAEGASGAPKLAAKFTSFNATAGSNLDITGLGSFKGALITYTYQNTGVANRTASLEYSSGGGFTGTITLLFAAAGTAGMATFFVDFSTGVVRGVHAGGVASSLITGTMAGASDAIVSLRVTGMTDTAHEALANPNGGDTTT